MTIESEPNQPPAYSVKATAAALLFYVLITLLLTWPLLGRLTTEFAGGRSDQLVHRWTFWWIKEALLSRQNPFYTTMLYYPEGVSLLSHNIAWLNIGFWLPVQAMVGEITAYNLMFTTIYSLNGFAMFLFARETTQQTLPAFMAGAVLCAWPYTLSHYDHPNMILLFPLPLALLYLGRLLRYQRWRDMVLTAVFIALLGIGRWQLLLMSLPLMAGVGLYNLYRHPVARSKKMIGKIFLAGGLALLFMLPFALPLIQSQLQPAPPGVAIYEPDNGRTNLISYIIPPQLYNLWSDQDYAQIAASLDYIPFIGYLTVLLAGLGLLQRWQQSRFWLLMALIYVMLALGPALAINQQLYLEGLTPYALLLEDSLIGNFIRRPHRFNIILSLPVGMMAGWGAVALLGWQPLQKQKWRAIMVVALLSLLLVAESKMAVPYTTTPLTMPVWYETMAKQKETFGLLEIPSYDRTFDKWYMAYQTQHGKPIAAGHISRLPAAARASLAENIPWFLYAIENDSFPDFNVTAVGRQLQHLNELNIHYVVLHKALMNEGLQALWRDWLTIPPSYEDDQLIVYKTDLSGNRGVNQARMLTPEIGLLRSTFMPKEIVQGGLLKIDARWISTAVPSASYRACFQLLAVHEVTPPKTMTAESCLNVSENYPTTEWPKNEVVRGSYSLPITEEILPGNYKLMLTLVDLEEKPFFDPALDLGQVTIFPYQPLVDINVTWNEQIMLDGYDVQLMDGSLVFIPYWRAIASIDNSNKWFLHLVNTADGQIAAQQDLVPLNWTYPTLAWEINERLRDPISLAIEHLPSGSYEIWLGWYEETSGERLQTSHGDERIYLQTIQITNQ